VSCGGTRGERVTRAALGRKALLGCGATLGCSMSWSKKGGGGGGNNRKAFQFQKPIKQMNSNKSLNSISQNSAPACMQQEIPIFHY
jgi:hypothetical protein